VVLLFNRGVTGLWHDVLFHCEEVVWDCLSVGDVRQGRDVEG
jgi:hypothetical protein